MDENDPDYVAPLHDFLVTCMNVECENAFAELQIKAPGESPNVVCGMCSLPITQVILLS